MKYILIKEDFITKIKNFDLSNSTYLIKISKKEILITNQNIIDKLLLQELFKKLNPVLNKIVFYLNDEEDNSESTGKFYDELAKQRSIIIKKYENFLSQKARDEYLKKIRFLALELKKRLTTYTYFEEKSKSR